MSCHNDSSNRLEDISTKKVLLVGNPNVGKSVIFSKLTGMHVESANYVGTTVEYKTGQSKIGFSEVTIIDAPGIYSLDVYSEAEKVTVELLNSSIDVIVCVLDATNLRRNLDMALQLGAYRVPVIYVLNLVDVAMRQGTQIDTKQLSSYLGAPVVEMIAVKNVGMKDLVKYILRPHIQQQELTFISDERQRYQMGREITQNVERREAYKPTLLDKLERATVMSWPGIPIAMLVLITAIGFVVGGGKGLRAAILLPLVRNVYAPWITGVIESLVSIDFIRQLLIGEFGVLIIGIEWPFALILPYVMLFYLVFTFLEDCGYLPRVAVLTDGLLKRIGIHGGNMIPLLMGFGCAVPAILGTRTAASKKERLIVTSLIAFAIPCASQSGAFIALLGDRSLFAMVFMFVFAFLLIILVGVVLNKTIKGASAPLLLEIPNILLPDPKSFFKKFLMKMKHFLMDAEGAMLVGIVLAALIAETGVLDQFSRLIEPIVTGWLGLPKEASLALLLGIIRRELAVLPLIDMNLSTLQLLVGATMALLYLPCLSVFGVLVKEFSMKTAIVIGVSTTVSAFIFAGFINQIGRFLVMIF